MPPKKQRKQKQGESSPHASGEKNDSKEEEKKATEKFSCQCGKIYGSLAAVHTHINNKHSETPEEKKFFKSKILNPKKNGQPQTNSIRMKDINFNDTEAELMCLADICLKNIYDQFKDGKEAAVNIKDDILINVNDDFEDQQDLDIDQLLGMSETEKDNRGTVSRRQAEINTSVKKMKEQYGLEKMLQYVEEAQQFKSFRLKKFRLSMIPELSKFFVPSFAAKVELTLQIFHVLKKHEGGNEELSRQLYMALDKMWTPLPNLRKVKTILDQYYNDWLDIKKDLKAWRIKQDEKEKVNQLKREQ